MTTMTNTETRAACPEHRMGDLFRNASTGHLHCTVGGTECVTWADLTEPHHIGADGYVYAADATCRSCGHAGHGDADH